MKFLITGGAGQLGRAVCLLISESGNDAIAFDLPHISWDHISGVEITRGDITDTVSVSEACEDIDVVVHLAALLPPKSEVNPELTYRVNVKGTANLVEAINEKLNVPLIFASSISTYGLTASEDPPLDETHPQVAHTTYSDSKIKAEKLIIESGIPYAILRIAPIAVADVIELPDVVPYRADQRVEFLYLDDAANALYKAANNSMAIGKILNIAGGSSWQITGMNYIDNFYKSLGVDVEPNFSDDYTAIDWYDTNNSRFLDYQKTTFNDFLEKLKAEAKKLGLV